MHKKELQKKEQSLIMGFVSGVRELIDCILVLR